MVHRRWMILGWVLILAALSSVGCSLIDAPDQDREREDLGSGTVIIGVSTEPIGQAGMFQFTGVPTGTVGTDGTLVVTDLPPGTYTTTQVDPAPDFDVTGVSCDDGASGTPSSGDPQTRTAIFNLDAGETVRCTFTNTQRGTAVIVTATEPEGASGTFQFTGVPSGTIPSNGTLVVADLPPGTYTSTEVDPAPQFDLTAVSCDDDGSATASQGDPTTRSAIFQVDPGEMVQCTFVNTRRGTVIVSPEVPSGNSLARFIYTGVPTGTVASGGELIVTNLAPGTYTTTEVDPAPDFELSDVSCDDGASGTASSGDAGTRTAVFNVDPGETVRCVFSHGPITSTVEGGDRSGADAASDGRTSDDRINPFDNPEEDLANFPLPDELPPDAGSATVPNAGPWLAANLTGQLDCGVTSLSMPAQPPEVGVIEVRDGGQTLVGRGLQDDETAPIVMTADPRVLGRYTGTVEGIEEGLPVTITFVWQVVTEEYIVGYLTSSFTSEGVTCHVYRPYELTYND